VNVVIVDYYAATNHTFLGIRADLGTSIFALDRMAGWCADPARATFATP